MAWVPRGGVERGCSGTLLTRRGTSGRQSREETRCMDSPTVLADIPSTDSSGDEVDAVLQCLRDDVDGVSRDPDRCCPVRRWRCAARPMPVAFDLVQTDLFSAAPTAASCTLMLMMTMPTMHRAVEAGEVINRRRTWARWSVEFRPTSRTPRATSSARTVARLSACRCCDARGAGRIVRRRTRTRRSACGLLVSCAATIPDEASARQLVVSRSGCCWSPRPTRSAPGSSLCRAVVEPSTVTRASRNMSARPYLFGVAVLVGEVDHLVDPGPDDGLAHVGHGNSVA